MFDLGWGSTSKGALFYVGWAGIFGSIPIAELESVYQLDPLLSTASIELSGSDYSVLLSGSGAFIGEALCSGGVVYTFSSIVRVDPLKVMSTPTVLNSEIRVDLNENASLTAKLESKAENVRVTESNSRPVIYSNTGAIS